MKMLLLICSISASCTLQAQALVFDSLTISQVPEGYSRQSQAESIQLSNYNQRQQPPVTLTFFRGTPAGTKADADFAQAWRRLWALPDTAIPPRMRRLYTEEGLALYASVPDSRAPKTDAYKGMYLYWKPGYCIPVRIDAGTLAEWRQMQYTWEPILQSAKWRRK